MYLFADTKRENATDSESESESEIGRSIVEQDEDRRRTMLEAKREGDTDLNMLSGQSKIEDFKDYFRLPEIRSEHQPSSCQTRNVTRLDLTIDDDDGDDFSCDIQSLPTLRRSMTGVTASTSTRPVSFESPNIPAKRNSPQGM
jgi:hypothetical protein